MKRRTLILSGLGAGAALVVGWGVLPQRSRLGSATTLAAKEGEIGLNGWIKIAANGDVLLAMNRSEMGQGVHTALAMLARRRPCHRSTARRTAAQKTRNCMLSCGVSPGPSRLLPNSSDSDQLLCLPDPFTPANGFS